MPMSSLTPKVDSNALQKAHDMHVILSHRASG